MGDEIYKINTVAYDIFQILIYTGFRLSELWELKVNDIDFEHNILSLWKTKTNKPRSIPIVPKIKGILEKYISIARRAGKEELFSNWYNKKFELIFQKAKKEIGLGTDTQLVPHVLRHTCATRLVQSGVSLPIVKEWLGHSDISVCPALCGKLCQLIGRNLSVHDLPLSRHGYFIILTERTGQITAETSH